MNENTQSDKSNGGKTVLIFLLGIITAVIISGLFGNPVTSLIEYIASLFN